MAYELDEVRISQEVFYYLLEHFELHVPVMGYSLEDRECLPP